MAVYGLRRKFPLTGNFLYADALLPHFESLVECIAFCLFCRFGQIVGKRSGRLRKFFFGELQTALSVGSKFGGSEGLLAEKFSFGKCIGEEGSFNYFDREAA